ncbi:Rossmann-fold NAD(P)-binding domain-containing protein [Nocardiopsis oceani]
MRLAFARSDDPDDGRVGATPESVATLTGRGLEVEVETGAGKGAGHSDQDYRDAGAVIVDGDTLFARAETVVTVVPPSVERLATIAEGATLIGLLRPVHETDVARTLVERRVTAIAMELVPRISKAQSMDALSSQAGIAGYKAVLIAANGVDKLFPLSMTAAGTVKPARVVVLGVGVAGLQAIATAKRLGATVKANDVRAAAADEVSSLGADFIHIPGVTDQTDGAYAKKLGEELTRAQHEALAPHVAQADAVICTAQIPGRPAPTLLTAEMVERMPTGSVVVDLAAEDGGNCSLTDSGGQVDHGGVRVIPAPQLARSLPSEASALYARNIVNLLSRIVTDERELDVDADPELSGFVLAKDGEIRHEPAAAALASAGSADSMGAAS